MPVVTTGDIQTSVNLPASGNPLDNAIHSCLCLYVLYFMYVRCTYHSKFVLTVINYFFLKYGCTNILPTLSLDYNTALYMYVGFNMYAHEYMLRRSLPA